MRGSIATYLGIVLVGVCWAAEPIRSGPPVGIELPCTFEPLNVTGPDAGEKTCIFCEYGANPVVMVFAQGVSEPLTELLKRLDAATAREKDRSLGSCVIFLNDDARLIPKLKRLAAQEKFQHTILRTYKADGPKDYNLSPKADVTVLLICDRVVKASYAFAKGNLKDKDMKAVIADLAKILPMKE